METSEFFGKTGKGRGGERKLAAGKEGDAKASPASSGAGAEVPALRTSVERGEGRPGEPREACLT
jgi:hypothetical protein